LNGIERSAIAAGVLAVAVVTACNPSRLTEKAPPQSPDDAKTSELLRLNANRESDPALAGEYGRLNAHYFDGRLPPIPVRWEPRLAEVGPLIAEDFQLEGVTNGRLILLLPSLQADEQRLKRVLSHEMVHVALRDRPEVEHGPAFQELLRELSAKGAFTGIVATDDEKQAMRRALDARAKELAAEETELLGLRTRFEADASAHEKLVEDLNARTAAANLRQSGWPSESERAAANAELARLQDRSWEFNGRVRRFNDSVAAFNGLVEHYNLMTSYPDGLDRERVPRRAPMAQAK
jgi:hypothetical protein